MIIAISGTAGSGKSTIARMLAKKLGYRHHSMGDFQRSIAKEKGITIVELGELEKKDPSIDRMIDDHQIELGRKTDNFVIDSWLSSYFIPHAFKIFMDASLKERAKRITTKRQAESYTRIEDAMKAIGKREKTNQERFRKFYGYDYMKKSNYDLIVNTTGKDIEDVFKLILSKVKAHVPSFRYYDHTAEAMFEGYGKSLDKAFSNCGLAMFNLLVDITTVKSKVKKEFKIEADSKEKLLFDFLDELIYLLDTSALICSSLDVKIRKRGTRYSLACACKGDKASNYVTKGDIKAPTYNQMKIYRKGTLYAARAVVDI
jgi:CMP/dCMP kinase